MTKAGFLLIASGLLAHCLGDSTDADARRGSDFFQTHMCVNCHGATNGGPRKAPDLGRRYDRDYTPAGIAARMWNHAPVMWSAMSEQHIPLPNVAPEQAEDLFAFFYSVRYFEKPGEAQRGKRVFQAKHCTECHSITASGGGVGTPVERWVSLTDPIILVERMWNHADKMKGEMANRQITWPQFTSQEMDDLLVYLQNLPQTRSAKLEFTLPSAEGGAALFEKKGCTNCHKGALAFEGRLTDSTLTDLAAAMWNHSPQMQQPHPELSLPEIRQILGYIWARQFFHPAGDAERGRKTFESKKCAACHNDAASGAPALTKAAGPFSATGMVAVLWKHGPNMLRRMKEKRITWPQLSQTEMVNLIAYLNSR